MHSILKNYRDKSSCCLLVNSSVSAGFPSPAQDFSDKTLDLNEFVIKHSAATFFVRVHGDSMINAGISDGDILVVDRSLTPRSDQIVVAFLDGEFLVKRFEHTSSGISLVPENSLYKKIDIDESSDFEVWGIVTFVLKQLVQNI
ncbi:translesion error-prone DNA polymerase V autoproteolytic subunit [Candidatus Dojkabacteria bacterium]|nr:translesion error-prone DNA polymerase V autoproteolytic subunit [Candidatus Dojkabacteria bacterium]